MNTNRLRHDSSGVNAGFAFSVFGLLKENLPAAEMFVLCSRFDTIIVVAALIATIINSAMKSCKICLFFLLIRLLNVQL